MNTTYIIGIALWLLVAAFFSLFIIYFDRKKFATPRLGFVYILFFFLLGVGMLLGSMRLLQ